MKTYIAPEIIEIEVNASELIATSPDPDSKTIPVTLPGQGGDEDDPNNMAAPSYRNSLWND